jgi:hypothetical protein
MNLIAATVLSVLASGAARTDTTFTVAAGARLNVFNFGGEVKVIAWPHDRVRILADHTPYTLIEVQRKGPVLMVSSRAREAPARTVKYEISVPRWIDLNITGINNAVDVEGVDGDVLVESVSGGVHVKGGKGLLTLRSMQGGVRVDGAKGRVHASSVNEGVIVMDAAGEVVATTVNGNILLGRLVSDRVEASSANGDLIWDGEFRKSGRYQFGTHNGDILVVTAGRPDATVSVETFSGDFTSSYPVDLRQTRRGQAMNFTMGDGSAMVGFESFQGAIRLMQAGSAEAKLVLERRGRTLDQLQRQIERKQREMERVLERRLEERKKDDE